MSAVPNETRSDAEWRTLVADRDLRVAALSAQVDDLKKKLEATLFRVDQLTRNVFGRSSERYDDPNQLRLDLGPMTPVAPAGPMTVIPPEAKGIVPGKVVLPGKAKRKPIPEGIKAETMPLQELPPEQRVLPDGTKLVQIGVENETRLHLIPASFTAQVFPRAVYGLPGTTEPLLRTPPAPQIIPGGLPTTDLIIDVCHSKYDLHLPLHRQAKEYARMGVDLAKSTMCGWLGAFSEFLAPVVQAMRAQVFSATLLHSDDIPTDMLDESGKTIEARFWSYCDTQQVVFEFTQDRRGCHPTQALAGFFGALMADGLAQYRQIVAINMIVRLACWAHVRRKFYDARHLDARCQEMVLLINKLFAADARIDDAVKGGRLRGWDIPRRRWRLRQRYSKRVLAIIEARLTAWTPGGTEEATPDSPLGKAIIYAWNQWADLVRPFDTGDWPIHNNLAENVQRMIALGRKNHLFMGSEGGGIMAAIFYSIFQSCRLQRLDAVAYLRLVSERLLAGEKDAAALTPLRVREAGMLPQLELKK